MFPIRTHMSIASSYPKNEPYYVYVNMGGGPREFLTREYIGILMRAFAPRDHHFGKGQKSQITL